MTVREALSAAGFQDVSTTPGLDAQVLVGFVLGFSRARVLAEGRLLLEPEQLEGWNRVVERRRSGEPVAYIVGFKEFMGLDFVVQPGVLVPRPDTETLVEAALEELQRPRSAGSPLRPRVADVCTGTGCVAIALAHHAPQALEVWAFDIAPSAVETAQINARKHRMTIEVTRSDLLEKATGRFDLVVSNPPYLTPIETRHRVENEGWKEPALALDGGDDDGLGLIRRLVPQAKSFLNPGACLMLEAAPWQKTAIHQILEHAGFVVEEARPDLEGRSRVFIGRVGLPESAVETQEPTRRQERG